MALPISNNKKKKLEKYIFTIKSVNYRITEPQNGRGWKAPLWII